MKKLLMLICGMNVAWGNPFAIDFPEKKDVTNEDYIHIQEMLRQVDIKPYLNSICHEGYNCGDFERRSTRGLTQILIDPDRGFFPQIGLEKIGEGGDRCVVCCVPFDGVRSQLIFSLIQAFRDTGFNGYFYYRIGGFPNPTGEELRYVGVPYCFKIFLMLEAEQLGFSKVLWVDSSVVPLRDIAPLFEWLEETGAFINGWPPYWSLGYFVLPEIRNWLWHLTGTDVVNTTYINTTIFGLDMKHEMSKQVIREYYDYVKLGYPFVSCFPEEFVLTAIMRNFEGTPWQLHPYDLLINYIIPENAEERKVQMEGMRREGYYFYNRKH